MRDHFLAAEREKAKERQAAGKSTDGTAGGRGKKKPSPNFGEGLGRAKDKASQATGYSADTLDKVDAVAALAGGVVFCLRRNLEKQPRPTTRSIPGRCGYYQ